MSLIPQRYLDLLHKKKNLLQQLEVTDDPEHQQEIKLLIEEVEEELTAFSAELTL